MVTLLGIPFDFMGMTYYQTTKDVSLGTLVVCDTPHGTFLGRVTKIRKPTDEEKNKPDFTTLFPPIVRIATFSDQSFAREAEARSKEISRKAQEQADSLQLGMKVLKSYMDVENDKVLITFTSDGRVDFRELVRILNGMFHLRIELRQIGPRDQAKLVGGIGPCGLPLCCSTFLNTFDGISISMAKNQLLAINIPKLSGQCGKLMCCLKYEDKAYAEIRPLYPKIGEKFTYLNKNYEVTGLNLLTDTITTYNGDSYESFTKEEFERVKKGLTKVDETKLESVKDMNAGVDLSGHGIKDTNNRIAQIKKTEEKHKEELLHNASRDSGNRNNRRNNNRNNNQNNNRNNNNANAKNHSNNQNRKQNNNPTVKQNNSNNNSNSNSRNRSYSGSHNRSYGGHSNNYRGGNNYHSNNTNVKKESGFIPVSSIADKSVLDVKPVKEDDKK